MPDKPEKQAHKGNSNHVCYHVNKSCVWFAPDVQALLNRIVLLLIIFSEPQVIAPST
jgi:hypothetical protein